MITDLFTVENGKVKPSLHCYLIPEFKQIIDKYEKRSTDMLAYCFYYACPFKSINPYADYSDDDREDELKRSFVVFPDNPDILLAIEKMKSLYETMNMRHFKSLKSSLHKTMDYLDNVVITDDRDGNLAKVHTIQKDAGKVMESFNMLENKVESERGELKTRGDRKPGKGEF
jgi:hypothetical protein